MIEMITEYSCIILLSLYFCLGEQTVLFVKSTNEQRGATYLNVTGDLRAPGYLWQDPALIWPRYGPDMALMWP